MGTLSTPQVRPASERFPDQSAINLAGVDHVELPARGRIKSNTAVAARILAGDE